MSTSALHQAVQGEMAVPHEGTSRPSSGMSVHQANRTKKEIETNAQAIQNRIRHFQREEEKIWRDLEEVRRQASTIEEGRSRTLEKKLADRTIQQEKELGVELNRARAAALKTNSVEQRKRNQFTAMREKQVAGQEQRRASQHILRQKKQQEAQVRLQNSTRAAAIQRQQLEAKLKVNEERQAKIEMLKEQQEHDRLIAQGEVQDVESRLPQLEAEELVCLQRLQNSRLVTQSVLEELESSLGKQSSVTTLLRQKQRGQEHMSEPHGLQGSPISENSASPTSPKRAW